MTPPASSGISGAKISPRCEIWLVEYFVRLRTSLYEIYFDDPEYNGQFLRTLDYAPLGAQIGEAWAAIAMRRATRSRRTRTKGELRTSMIVRRSRPLAGSDTN